MTKNRIAPPLRFQEFTDTWERRKLGEIAEQVKEKNLLLVEHETFSNSAEFGIVRQMDFFDHVITNEENIGGYYIVHADDFVYNPRISVMAPVGPISRNKLGRNGIMSPLYTVFRPHDVDYNYLEYYFKTDRWYSFMRFNGDTGARSDRFSIKINVFYEMPISIPELDEQRKIGTFLIHLNDLITLHQRKLEQQKQLKKYFLQNMFPVRGEKVPKIRFKGFTGDWEQRRLGEEAIEMLVGGDIDKSKVVENGKYPIYANALTNNGIVGYYNNYYRVKAPAVTVTGRGEIGHAQARMLDFTPVVRLLTICSNHNTYFLENAINNHKVIVESTGVPQLTVPQLASYKISFPISIEEENKIGDHFSNLDHLITLHQRKIEHLQALKKFMLQNLFV